MKFRLIESFEDNKVTGYPWKSFIKNIEETTNFLVDSAYKRKPSKWIELIDKNTKQIYDAEVTKYSDGTYELMLYNINKQFNESLSNESLKEDSWQSRRARIDKNKLNQLCAYIFGDEEVEPADSYMSFKYKDNYLLAATVMDGFQNSSNSAIERDQNAEGLIRKRAKEKGVKCRIEVEYHRERFDVIEGLVVRLMIPYELISK